MHTIDDSKTGIAILHHQTWTGEASVFFGPEDGRSELRVDAQSLILGIPKILNEDEIGGPFLAVCGFPALMRAVALAVNDYLVSKIYGLADDNSGGPIVEPEADDEDDDDVD